MLLRKSVCSITTSHFYKYQNCIQRNIGLLFENNVFLLHVLNKNENIINAGYWLLSENRKKLIPSKKNNLS